MVDPISAAITAGLGLINNKNSQNATHSAVQNALKTLQGTEGYSDALLDEGLASLQAMLEANGAIYGNPQDAAAELQAAKQGMNQISPYSAGQFDYNKSIDDFYDQAFQLSVNNANDAINQSQAMGGNLFSSDTANKIAAQNQVLATQMYKDALAGYQADKGLEQSIWQGNENALQQQAASEANLAQSRYNMANDTAGNIANAQNDYYSSLLGLFGDYYGNKADYAAQIAGLQAQDPGKSSGLFGLGGLLGIF